MIGAMEKSKLVYILNRVSTDFLCQLAGTTVS